jgi:hypothetical protein
MFIRGALLGSTAIVFNMVGAHAADLPTRKAAPVEYVKICNVAGMAGFVLPGSGACLKISGYITLQFEGGNLRQGYYWDYAAHGVGTASVGAHAGAPPGGGGNNPLGYAAKTRDMIGWTQRTQIGFDLREETSYGVLRAYADSRFEQGNGYDNTGNAAYADHAYVQWAGITAGKANSFFSFFNDGPGWVSFFSPDQIGSNEPDLLAYTAAFGDGYSATIAGQSSGTNGIGSGIGTNIPSNYTQLGMQAPDFVANLRVDQGWGSAQVAGVTHNVRGVDAAGHDTDEWGYGLLAAMKINLPALGAGDSVQWQGVYTDKAFWYSGIPISMWGASGAAGGNGLPLISGDSFSNGDGSWASPKVWTIAAMGEHHFSPQWSINPEASYVNLHWSGLNALSGAPTNAYSWIAGGVVHYDPVPNLDFALTFLYEYTHQATPATYLKTDGAPMAFANNTNGWESRFIVFRPF